MLRCHILFIAITLDCCRLIIDERAPLPLFRLPLPLLIYSALPQYSHADTLVPSLITLP